MMDYEETGSAINPMLPPSQLEERDQPDTDFTPWDFHPEEQNPP